MANAMYFIVAFVAVAITLLIAVPVTCKVAVSNKVKQDAEKIGTAEEKASPSAKLRRADSPYTTAMISSRCKKKPQ